MTRAAARAHSNIALIKYWGKADVAENLPAVPSLSMTLDQLYTETEVLLDPGLDTDQVELNGSPAGGAQDRRVILLLDRMRAQSSVQHHARVLTRNNFPTAAGLASSASGFAALALAASRAFGLQLSLPELSSLARWCSASAGRSIYGGFVELALGEHAAQPVQVAEGFDLALLVLTTTAAAKKVGSTTAMLHTERTSPYYPAWVKHAPRLFSQAKSALARGDLATLGTAMEHSTLLMHASMMGAAPAVIYWSPATLTLMNGVKELRESGCPCYFTMDAGPHVKVLTLASQRQRVRDALAQLPEVQTVYDCLPGPDAHITHSPTVDGTSLE